ncbi:ligand-dependent nuclear receptor-interacting factor 1 [Oreochromis niloticus]|uniref:Ligand dependent nuclear receptor interacting factor 1 n=1 Tax=Oreochromis niloticus TaxID=8128 RepID=A0A669EKB3_ORENI|nr:ligand-dependent nuclear receptor-interacting factor 1 [Oreochromis niloticus]
MDTIYSGQGVFYQAMPAIGPDGKNIMKLIPVQMVNRQFFQPQTSRTRRDPISQEAVTINITSAPVNMATDTALSSSVSQQIIRKQVSVMNVLYNHVHSVNNPSLQQQTVNLTAEVPSVTTFKEKSGMPVKLFNPLPVTVKSPALPRGQYLQIPPNAQVQTVPACRLPAAIQKQIFTSSASSFSGSALPSVVYVSPVTTMNQGGTLPTDTTAHSVRMFSNASTLTSCGFQPKEATQQLKLIPKVSQRPDSPTRWVIEEVDGSSGPNIKPLNCPSVTSEILQAIAQRENSSKQFSTFRKTASQLGQDNGAQGQENALVMCNGKVFFVAKRCALLSKTTTTTKGSELSKSILPQSSSLQQFLQSAVTQTSQDVRTQRESDEVIDLCDDDESPQQAVNMPAVSHLDEDNVIFVSYVPPKSESCSPRCTTSNMALRGAEAVQDTSDRNDRCVCDSDVLHSTSAQQLEDVEADAKTESPAVASSSFQTESNSQITKGSTNPESVAPKPRKVSDHLLRQIFGITAELKLCLQRVDEPSVESVPANSLHIESIKSVEDNEEPVVDVFRYEGSGSQETNINSGHTDILKVKVQTGKELLASPDTGVGALRCSHVKLDQKPPRFAWKQKFFSGQRSHNRASCDCESKPETDCLEPVGEDVPNINEGSIPQSQYVDAHLRTQTWLDLSRNTRRIGRTRKRTVCPCCMPTTLDHAVKSRARLEELDKWDFTAEQVNKKGGRAKVPRKDGMMNCGKVKNKQNCVTHEGYSNILSTTSTDRDELQRKERIKRLKYYLTEKEAALQLMKRKVS